MNENGAVTSYSANALNQYTSITGLAVNHADGRGNLTQLGGWTYVYDADNRLKQASTTGNTMEFFYDPEGRLTRVNRNGIPEYRYYDWGQCFLRTQADGTWIDFMIWGPTPDELTSRWDAAHGGWMFFHHTPVNSPDLATDIGGNVVERYLYDPFGAPDIRDPSWGSRSSSVIANPWLFTGQEWMSDTGLSNYKARFYSPKLGRFLQNDPVRFEAGDVNLYRYCGNSSIVRSDPEGTVWSLAPAAVGAAGGAATGFISGAAKQGVQAAKGGDFNWKEVGISTAAGALGGAAAGAVAGLATGDPTAIAIFASATGALTSGAADGLLSKTSSSPPVSSGDLVITLAPEMIVTAAPLSPKEAEVELPPDSPTITFKIKEPKNEAPGTSQPEVNDKTN